MATTNTLQYVGPTAANSSDLVNSGYVTGLLSTALTQAAVNTQITTTLAGFGYATKDYITTQGALNASQTYIQTQAALYIPLAQVGIPNGTAPLGSNGRIPPANLTLPSTQRYPSPYFSPTGYYSTAQTSLSTPTQLFTMAIADPGYAYKLMIHGVIDGQISTDGQYPVIRVCQGSPTGQLVGIGAGLGEYYTPGVQTLYSVPNSVSNPYVYTIPSFAAAVDAIALGGGGGAQASFFAQGQGGSAGAFKTTTYTKGGNWPSPTLNVVCGAPGIGGATSGAAATSGSASTVSGVGFTTITGAGGAAGGNSFNWQGDASGGVSYNGTIYGGGPIQTTPGGTGNSPGGGGASGAFGGVNPGGAGAPGAVWLLAYPAPDVPGGPITIITAPLNAQAAITGPTTLYVMLTSSALLGALSGTTAIATAIRPLLQAVPIPA